jgi:hypothetical protein
MLLTVLAGVRLAAGEIEEIMKDYEFFADYEIIANLDGAYALHASSTAAYAVHRSSHIEE